MFGTASALLLCRDRSSSQSDRSPSRYTSRVNGEDRPRARRATGPRRQLPHPMADAARSRRSRNIRRSRPRNFSGNENQPTGAKSRAARRETRRAVRARDFCFFHSIRKGPIAATRRLGRFPGISAAGRREATGSSPASRRLIECARHSPESFSEAIKDKRAPSRPVVAEHVPHVSHSRALYAAHRHASHGVRCRPARAAKANSPALRDLLRPHGRTARISATALRRAGNRRAASRELLHPRPRSAPIATRARRGAGNYRARPGVLCPRAGARAGKQTPGCQWNL